jgi:putative membrane protein insertion efficiency factor
VTLRLFHPLRRVSIALLVAPIRAYRWCISPMFVSPCRFLPTCSEYAIEALQKHGPVKGLVLTARRLLRCHPITWLGGSSGFDPVPPIRTR